MLPRDTLGPNVMHVRKPAQQNQKMCLGNTKNILFGQMGSQGEKSTACIKPTSDWGRFFNLFVKNDNY